MKRLNSEILKERLFDKYNNKYDYSKVEYVNCNTKVCIICPEHGEFWATPSNLLSKYRKDACSKCSAIQQYNDRRLTEEQIRNKIKEVHQIEYQINFKTYKNNKDKIEVLCPEHGWFNISVGNICSGRGCPKCRYIKSSQKQIKGDKIWRETINKIGQGKIILCEDESYTQQDKKCKFICPIHGEFYSTIESIINSLKNGNNGCNECKKDKLRKIHTTSWEKTLQKMNLKHNFKYEYDKDTYVNKRSKLKIICPEHGEFWQTPHSHLQGAGCPKCGGNLPLIMEEFVEKAKKVHDHKYDYSKTEYINYDTKVCIICPEHGEFWQTPHNHLNNNGCPKCNQSHLERDVMNVLKEHNINYETQKRFEWLGLQSLDFYLPDYNIAIECQGRQHFECVEHFGGKEEFEKIKLRDKIKKELCEEHNVKSIYYSNLEYDTFLNECVFHNEQNLLTKIKENNLVNI